MIQLIKNQIFSTGAIMATGNRGGKRAGAGRPVGAVSSSSHALRDAARAHTETAMSVLVSVMNDESNPHRLKAAEMLLERAWGKPTTESAAGAIIGRFMSGDITAIQAALELEANGLSVGAVLMQYVQNEISVNDNSIFATYPLPRPFDPSTTPESEAA